MLLYILIILSFLIGIYSVYRDGIWKGKVLATLEDIHICAFSANQTNVKLLKLAQGIEDEEVMSDYGWGFLDEEEKVSDR